MPAPQQERMLEEQEKNILLQMDRLENAIIDAVKVQKGEIKRIQKLDKVVYKIFKKLRKVTKFELKEGQTIEQLMAQVDKLWAERKPSAALNLWKKTAKLHKKKLRQFSKIAKPIVKLETELNQGVALSADVARRFRIVADELKPVLLDLRRAAGLEVYARRLEGK